MSKFSSNKIENMHLWGIKCIIFLIPFIPLYVSTSLMFPFITGKNFAFRILVEFAAALWLGLMFMNKEYRLQNSLMLSSVLIFTFVVGLANLFGVSPYNSLWSNYERMEGYITILHLALYFLIIRSILTTRKDWMIFFGIYLIASLFVSLFTFVEPGSIKQSSHYIVEYGIRRAGTIGNPPFLASYLLLSVFAGLILILMIQRVYLKLLCLSIVIIDLFVIYLTASRGAILSAFIGIVIIGGYLLFRKFKGPSKVKIRKAIPLVVGILIIFSIYLLVYNNIELLKSDRTISRFTNIFSDDSAIGTRFYAWKMVWNGFKENPILGWGQENFIGVYKVNPVLSTGTFVWLDRAHNIVMDWLINAGVLGLFSYLAILGSALYSLWNNRQKEIITENMALIIFTAIIVYFIQNLFTFDTINSYIIFFALLAYIDNIESIKKASSNSFKDNVISKKIRMQSITVTLIALLAFVLFSYFINYLPLKQLKKYSRINMNLSKYNSFSTMLDDFDETLSYGTFGNNYIRRQMTEISMSLIHYQFTDQEGATQFIQRSAEEIGKGLATSRYDLEYILTAINLYLKIAPYNSSYISVTEELVEEYMRINPQFQRFIDMIMVDILLIKKDFEGAFNSMKKIAELSPGSDTLQFKLALTGIFTSREKIVNKALENAKKIRIGRNKKIAEGKEPVFNVKQLLMLARAYKGVKHFDKAMQYYRRIITILPDDKNLRSLNNKNQLTLKAGFHLEIAGIYVILADKDNAIKEAEKAAELDPENYSDKVKMIIDSLNN